MRRNTPAIVTHPQFRTFLASVSRGRSATVQPTRPLVMHGRTFMPPLLATLLGSVSRTTFLRNYFDKQPYFHRSGVDPAVQFPAERLLAILARTRLEGSTLECFEPDRRWFVPGARERRRLREEVRHGRGGTSFRIRRIYRQDPFCSQIVRDLQNFSGEPVTAHGYYTPRRSQTFPCHFDCHGVFVFQVHGSKHWKVYAPVSPKPLYGEGDARAPRPRSLTWSRVLRPGDVLFIPRGFLHEARCGDEASFHLTCGIFPRQTLDVAAHLVRRAVEDQCRKEAAMRTVLLSAERRHRMTPTTIARDFLRCLTRQMASDRANGRLQRFLLPKMNLPTRRFRRMSVHQAMTATFVRTATPCVLETYAALGICAIDVGDDMVVIPLRHRRHVERMLRSTGRFTPGAGTRGGRDLSFWRSVVLLFQTSLIDVPEETLRRSRTAPPR